MNSIRFIHLVILPAYKFYYGIINIIAGRIINGEIDIIKLGSGLAGIPVTF